MGAEGEARSGSSWMRDGTEGAPAPPQRLGAEGTPGEMGFPEEYGARQRGQDKMSASGTAARTTDREKLHRVTSYRGARKII